MAEQTFENHLDNLRSIQAASARVAVDFMDGAQLEHLKDYLDTPGEGIKNWRNRGILPLWENITGLIIDRSAQTYQRDPDRIVINEDGTENEAGTEAYSKVLEDSNVDEVLEDADMLARLLNASIVVAQYNDDKKNIYFSAVSQHNADVTYDRPSQTLTSLLYTGGGIGPKGGLLYHFWDQDTVVDIEINDIPGSTTISGTIVPGSKMDTGLGLVPGAVLYDIKPPRAGFWGKNKWDQLINFNLGINMYHTEMKFNQRFQSIGALFTNADVPENMIIGPDSIVKLEQPHPDVAIFLDYKAPSSISVAIGAFGKWLDSFRENVGQEWGVNIKVAGEGSAESGFQLVVEELPGLQLRTKRQKPADTFEQSLYQVCLAISNQYNLGLVAGTKLKVKFPEPDLPVNLKEKAEIESIELANKLITREELWLKRDPSLTAEDIAAKKAAIDADSGLANLPDFEGA